LAVLLDGKLIAQSMRESLRARVQTFCFKPVLACIQAGETRDAGAYIQAQQKAAEQIGVEYRVHRCASDISADVMRDLVHSLNADPAVNGIIIQSPLPKHLNYVETISLVDPAKDAEGMHPENLGRVVYGSGSLIPCTAGAVMELLATTEIRGKEAVVVGHSEIVGKPLALLLLARLATVTVCHVATSEAGLLRAHVERADILVVAVGKPRLIKGSWIKEGSTVIDVGINRDGDRIVGDVEFDEALNRAAAITPVPGGVGPVTVALLLRNLLNASEAQMVEGQRSKAEGKT
jgi:methylenetetrahydrofolate dehydrogenase (NADP+) / methenyltetrahydrofolate cyclohydrolase